MRLMGGAEWRVEGRFDGGRWQKDEQKIVGMGGMQSGEKKADG